MVAGLGDLDDRRHPTQLVVHVGSDVSVTSPCSERSGASRQRTWDRYGRATERMPPANWANTWRSNFQRQPPSTRRGERRATWSRT
jgi:hypothetical protein